MMGLKNQESSGYLFTTIIGVSKTDDRKLGFEVKNGDNIQTGNIISGKITKIENYSYEYEDKNGKKQKRDAFKLYIQDFPDTYVLSSGFTQIGKSILNSLASAEKFGEVEIKLYINKNKFDSVYLSNDGQPMRWKYTIEELNKKVHQMTKSNGEIIMDYSELDEFYKTAVIGDIKKIIEKTDELNEKFIKPEDKEDLPF